MEKLICLEDYKETTKSKLSELIWYYITNGAGLGRTAIDNVEAYKRLVSRVGNICIPKLRQYIDFDHSKCFTILFQISHTSTSSV